MNPDWTPDERDFATARASAASRSIRLSVAVNLLLTLLQLNVGIFAKSQALVADALHSLSDLVADFIVLLAARHGSRDPDIEHPYGHQRFETAASLALGILLVAVGLGMLWSAVGRLQTPSVVPVVHVAALWVAGFTLIAKEGLFRYMLAIAKRAKSNMLVANAWHARADAASSLVVAAGIAGNLAGYPLLDPVAALFVGLLVARSGWRFAWDALRDLMDRAADETEVAAIRETLETTPGVSGVHDLCTRRMGDMIVIDVHLEVDPSLSVVAGHDIAVAARARVMQRHRVLNVMTHVDPRGRLDLEYNPLLDRRGPETEPSD